jgi:transposase
VIVSGLRVQGKCPHREASIILNRDEQKRLIVLNAVLAGQSTVAELAAFARAAGASPRKQIVLVLNRVGWHTSVRLRVPEHVHLLFLPPYSPELQPAEHLGPLTNSVLINQHFATIDEHCISAVMLSFAIHRGVSYRRAE